jgi:LmbE family N-acetylglucosaminyl deacetylase
MNRREFLKLSLGAAAGTALSSSLLSACASHQLLRDGAPPIDELIEKHARVMWVAAHPDDESLAGAIMAKAGPRLGNALYMHVLTHGEGGDCLIPEGCHPDVATVRGEELKQVAKLYGATLEHDFYWNAPLPTETFPPRQKIAERWVKDGGDPAAKIAKSIRTFKPDILLTFSPIRGFTGHPEHQLASRFATAAVRLAAKTDPAAPGEPYKVPYTYYCVNKYWIYRLLGISDPLPYTEKFNARQPCIDDLLCIDVAAEFTRPHRTQANDMGAVRKVAKFIQFIYLRRTDPFTEIYDPFEPVEHGGMV